MLVTSIHAGIIAQKRNF